MVSVGTRPSVGAGRTVCFFCKTADPGILERIDFYARDLQALRELGFRVHIATHPRQLITADLYFVWWWTWAFAPVAFARALDRPVVITGTFDLWMFAARPAPHRWLHDMALRAASANVFLSRLEEREVSARFRVKRPRYVPLGIDTTLFEPGGEREPFLLTIAGSGMDQGNSVRKGLPELIRAMPEIHAAHPGIRFVIVGKKGTDYPELVRLADEVGATPYVDFPGIVSHEEKRSLLRRCRAYLQPTRHEGFGLGILEAMSSGAPVVTNAAGAVPELGADTVVYAAECSPAAIAAAVVPLLGDPDRLASLSARARVRAVERFGPTVRTTGLEAVIREVLPA